MLLLSLCVAGRGDAFTHFLFLSCPHAPVLVESALGSGGKYPEDFLLVKEDLCRSTSPVSCTGVFHLGNCMEVGRRQEETGRDGGEGCWLLHRTAAQTWHCQKFSTGGLPFVVLVGHDQLLQGFVGIQLSIGTMGMGWSIALLC